MSQDLISNVFSYRNYRELLADFYQKKKNSPQGYSYRQFSQKAGFRSPNVLKEVIEGQRNLTSQSLAQFLKALNLDAKEEEYFRCLVAMNQSSNEEEMLLHSQRLETLRPLSNTFEIESDKMEFMRHWIYAVIQELVNNPGFRDDPHWISRRLTGAASLGEISKALSFLKSEGFILKNADNKFELRNPAIKSSDEVINLALRAYYRSVLQQSVSMFDDLPVHRREFGALVFYLPDEDFNELKKKMKDFINELHQWTLSRNRSTGEVIQFTFQMYPQTKNPVATDV